MNKLRKILLTQDDTMDLAIKVLKNPYEIVLITDKNDELIGTVTDGDIRRALLKHFTNDKKLSFIMNKNPITCKQNTPKAKINACLEKNNIKQIPIIDKDNKVIDIFVSSLLESRRIYQNSVFLMAGGFGKRLQPLTNNTPKPMLKLGEKAILEIIIDSFISQGFQKFYISTHFEAEQITDYFGDGSRLGVTIKYVHEEKPLGTAGALGLLPKDLELPIVMMNGDLITKVDFSKIINFHNEDSAQITMCTRKFDFQVPYGVIKLEGSRVRKIEEKPTQSFFVNAGVYIINPKVFADMNGYSYIDMPNLIEENIKLGKNVTTFPMHEYWLDIGKIDNYKKAQKELIHLKDGD